MCKSCSAQGERGGEARIGDSKPLHSLSLACWVGREAKLTRELQMREERRRAQEEARDRRRLEVRGCVCEHVCVDGCGCGCLFFYVCRIQGGRGLPSLFPSASLDLLLNVMGEGEGEGGSWSLYHVVSDCVVVCCVCQVEMFRKARRVRETQEYQRKQEAQRLQASVCHRFTQAVRGLTPQRAGSLSPAVLTVAHATHPLHTYAPFLSYPLDPSTSPTVLLLWLLLCSFFVPCSGAQPVPSCHEGVLLGPMEQDQSCGQAKPQPGPDSTVRQGLHAGPSVLLLCLSSDALPLWVLLLSLSSDALRLGAAVGAA